MTSSVRFAGLMIVRSILACGLLIAAAPRLWAGDEHVVGVLSLAVEPAVLKELGLSDEAKQKLTEYVNKRVDESASLVLEIKDLDQAEQKTKLQPFVEESEKEGLKLLTAEQQKKLQQLRLQRLGMAALLEKGIAEQLGLDASTRGKLDVMVQLHELQTAAVPAAEKAKAKVELEKKMLGMLSPEQRTKWEAMEGRTGKEVAGAEVEPPAESPTTDKPATTKPGDKPTTDQPATERPSGLRPPAATTLKPANPNAGLKAGDPNIKIKFQFQYAPWKDVIEWFATQADYSLVTANFPTGTFNYTDTRAYTPAQAIDLLNSVLITKGYRLVRRERMLFLLSSEDELPDTFAPRIEEKDLEKQGDFEIVQCQFQLHKVTAEEAELEVKKLVGPQGKVIVLSKAKQIVVTEAAGTLRLIRNAIKSIENPDTTKDEEVVVVKMDHIRPSEFMTLAGELLGIPAGMKATPDGSLKISADELGMRLIVTGKPEKITRLNDIKAKVDIVGGDPSAVGTTVEQPQLIIYTLHNADPVSVHAILSTMLAGQPDVRLSVDPKSGNLVALCRLAQHATIRGLLSEMQKDATKPVVFRLNKNDPQAVTLQINELFGGGEKGAPNAPKVVADPTNLQIIVKATPSQLAQIEELLKGMGELGGSGATAGTPVARQHIRYMQGSSARSLESAFSQLESVWPTVAANQNKLKVHRINRPAEKGPGATPPKAGEKPLSPEEKAFRDEFRLDDPASRSSRPATPSNVAPPMPAPAAPAVPAPTLKDSTRANRGSSSKFHFVSQPGAEPEKKPENGSTNSSTPSAAPKSAEETPAEKLPEEKNVPGADITVSIGPNGIMIASDDLDALDEFEARLKQVLDSRGNAKEPRIIYLKYAKAPVAAALLQEILGGGAAAPSEGGGGGGLMGDLASSMMGDSFLGGLLGMGGGGGGGSSTATGGATIIPDIRLNALFVQASPRDMDVIDEYLTHIDQPESPEGPQPNSAPRFIPVLNTTADAIAVVVRQVYSGRLNAEAGGGQQRQPSPEDFIRALRGGRGGQQQQQNKGEEQKMTIGVDTRTNSLIVTAPDYLFKEVESLVKQLDVSEVDSDTTVKVVSLRSANADLITRSLASVYPGSITTTKTATAASTGFGRSGTQGGQRPPGQGQQAAPQQGGPQQQQQGISDDARRQMEIFNALQGAGGRGGGGGGGNFGGGGRGGGGAGGFGGGGRGGR